MRFLFILLFATRIAADASSSINDASPSTSTRTLTSTSTRIVRVQVTSTATIPAVSNHVEIIASQESVSKETESTAISKEPSTTTTTAGGPMGTTSSNDTTSKSYTSDIDFQTTMMAAHDFFREEHNATSLKWNSTSAKYAAKYAEGCAFKHSGGPTGENLAAGYVNASTAVNAWGLEREEFNFSNPGFSEATGHFTQMVWKATASVGCGRYACDGKNGTTGYYVVCEYYPPGNIGGEYTAQVDKLTKGNLTLGYGMGPGSTAGYGWIIGIVVGVCANIVFVVMLIWKLS